MNANHSHDATAPAATRKATGKRALIAALLASSLALAGLGFASGTAQAQKPSHCVRVCDHDGFCYEVCR